jgi:hypothetical protein
VIVAQAIAESAEHLREGQSAVSARGPRLEYLELDLEPGEFCPVVSTLGLANTDKAFL